MKKSIVEDLHKRKDKNKKDCWKLDSRIGPSKNFKILLQLMKSMARMHMTGFKKLSRPNL